MVTATAAGTLPALVSLLLSFILPFTMLTSTINPGEMATVTSTLTGTNAETGLEEVYGVEAMLYRTEENDLNASFTANENGVKAGVAFKDDKLHLIRGEGSSTVEEYIERMERAVANGLATKEDLSFYKELVALQPVFSYLLDGRFMEDVNTVTPWLRGKMPVMEQLLGIRTTKLEGYRTQYNFTLHLRDLPAAFFNVALRSLASPSFRTMINSLHVWDLVEGAPANAADYLLLGVGGTGLDLDDLPALTLPVEMVVSANGTLESLSAETVYYEGYNYAEIEVNYADGHLQAAIRPYSVSNRSTMQYASDGVMELEISAGQNGGSVDFYFQEDEDSTLHFFANYQLMGGKLWSADAQYTFADYDTCTATLTYRPGSLVVTTLVDDSVMTGNLLWAKTNQALSYWLDVSAAHSYTDEMGTLSVSGRASWQDQFNHDFQLSSTDGMSGASFKMNVNQKLVHEGNKYTHDVTATVSETGPDGRNVTVPINWNTVIILK